MLSVVELCHHNAVAADAVGETETGHTWRIIAELWTSRKVETDGDALASPVVTPGRPSSSDADNMRGTPQLTSFIHDQYIFFAHFNL